MSTAAPGAMPWTVDGNTCLMAGNGMYGEPGPYQVGMIDVDLGMVSPEQSTGTYTIFYPTSSLDGVRELPSDRPFKGLARAILNGQLAPQAQLASAAALAREHAVSSLVMRQALRRIEKLKLVARSNGGALVVQDLLDVQCSLDLPVLQELVTVDDPFVLAVLERQALLPLGLLALAERHISEAELDALDALLVQLPEHPEPVEWVEFRRRFWSDIAAATRNPLVKRQVLSWMRAQDELDRLRAADDTSPRWPDFTAASSPCLYTQLVRALRRRNGAAVRCWLRFLPRVLARLEWHKRSQ